jgi:hypothetical protein
MFSNRPFEELFGPYLELGHEVFEEKPYSFNTIVANALQEPIDEEIAETESSLDEKEEESDDQEEEEWSYPCLPLSNSLTHTLFDNCHDSIDSFGISLFDEVDRDKHALCDTYIVEFVHDATENYFERGKFGCWNFHVTKTPLFILKVLKLILLYLPMLGTLCFLDLFSYKIPMHRKWFRLKCVSYFLLDALYCFNSYFLCEHLLTFLRLAERR